MKSTNKLKLLLFFIVIGTNAYSQSSVSITLPPVYPEADCYPGGSYIYHTYTVVKISGLETGEEYWVTEKYIPHNGALQTNPIYPLELERDDLENSGEWDFVQLGIGGEGNLYEYTGTSGTYDVEYTFYIYNQNLIINKYATIGIYVRKDDELYPATKFNQIKVIKLDCGINGPSLICSGSKTFTLTHDNPSQPYSSISWNMSYPGGSSSGSGKVASRNFGTNPTNGEGNITYTVDHTCGIPDQIFSKDFWVGKPLPTILGEDEIFCDFPQWYFLDNTSIQFGNFQWSTSNNLNIIGTTTGHKAQVEADSDEDDIGYVYVDVTNSCGTRGDNQIVYIYCGWFMVMPNPVDQYLDVIVDDNKISASELSINGGYQICIFDSFGKLLTNILSSNMSQRINTSNFKDGIYILNIIYNNKVFKKEVIIEH